VTQRRNPILLTAVAIVLGGAALVVLIRSLIPSGSEIDVSSVALTPFAQDDASVAEPSIDATVLVPVARVEDVVHATAVAAPPVAAPVFVQAPSHEPIDAGLVAPSVNAVVPGPIEPLERIRPDIERLRAQIEALRAGAADGGPRASNAVLEPMALLVNGAPIVRRLIAGDPTFAAQVDRYRAALARAGALDANARAALRASIFTAPYAERAAAYDELLALTR
jgi:hypothetical protein